MTTTFAPPMLGGGSQEPITGINNILQSLAGFGVQPPFPTPTQNFPVTAPALANYTGNLNIPGMGAVNNAGLSDLLASPTSSVASMDLTNQGSIMDRFNVALQRSGVLGSTDPVTKVRTDGWGTPAISLLSGLGQLFMGMKQYGLAKNMAADARSQFERNYNSQRQVLNTRMEDRQRARVSANKNAESVESYMNRNRV